MQSTAQRWPNLIDLLCRVEEIGQSSRLRWLGLFFLFLVIIPAGLVAILWIFGPLGKPYMQMVVGAGIERGLYPNYISLDLISYFEAAGSYLQSPDWSFFQKANLLLSYQIFSIASFDHAAGGTNWNLSIGAVIALGITASAYHLATHFNILIALIKSQKTRKFKGKVSNVIAPACAAGGNVGNAFVATMIPLACCGGAGVILLFFTLAGIGATAGYLLNILGGAFSITFAAPTTVFILILTIHMAKRLRVFQIHNDERTQASKLSTIKSVLYPLISVLFIGILALGLYAYGVQVQEGRGSADLGYDPAMFVSLAPAAILLSGAAVMESRKVTKKYLRVNVRILQVAAMLIGVGIIVGMTGFLAYSPSQTTLAVANPQNIALVSWNHIHSIGIDPKDQDTVYVATHHGLYRWSENSGWGVVGAEKFDLMSFITHPYESNIMYASGHPPAAPVLNLGFMGSTDAGLTWQKISNVLDSSPIDFHAMAISAADPNIIYGYSSHEGLFKTTDGGKNWEQINLPRDSAGILSLAAHPKDVNQVIAVTNDGKTLRSLDQGKTWKYVNWVSMEFTVVAYGNDGTLYAFVTKDPMGMGMGMRIAKSIDDGKTWVPIGSGFANGEVVFAIAASPSNPEMVYTASMLGTKTGTILSVYKSSDGGINFNLLGTNDKTHPLLSGQQLSLEPLPPTQREETMTEMKMNMMMYDVMFEDRVFQVTAMSDYDLPKTIEFSQEKKTISLELTNLMKDMAHLEITIPKDLLSGEFTGTLGGKEFKLIQDDRAMETTLHGNIMKSFIEENGIGDSALMVVKLK